MAGSAELVNYGGTRVVIRSATKKIAELAVKDAGEKAAVFWLKVHSKGRTYSVKVK